jgi:hypothetical protein
MNPPVRFVEAAWSRLAKAFALDILVEAALRCQPGVAE